MFPLLNTGEKNIASRDGNIWCQTFLELGFWGDLKSQRCSVWGCRGKTESDRLQKLQNRAARIVTNSSYDAPSVPLVRSLGWETVDDLISQEIETIAYKSVNHLAPQNVIDLFTRNSHSSSHSIRNTDSHIQIPKKKHQLDRSGSRIGVLKFGIVYRGEQNRHLP